MSKKLVAKFVCEAVSPGDTESISLVASTQENNGNDNWSQWTPSGQLRMAISNKAAHGSVEQGKQYLITIEEAPSSEGQGG